VYGEDDVARSVRRYVAAMLGDAWHLDLERKEVVDDARPAGVIETGPVTTVGARTAIDQGNVTESMALTVTLYPALAEPRTAGREARKLAQRLRLLVVSGAEGIVFQGGRPASGPERIPLYDYANIPLVGTVAERRGPDFPHDVLWVEDYSVRPIQDALDAERWTVALDCRVSWERPGRVPPEAPITTAMPGTATYA